jgi:hypothetical protein
LKLEGGKEWETLNVVLPKALSSVGIFQLSIKEMVIFGGWSDVNQNACYFLKEENPNKFVVNVEDECLLQDADIFLFNGAVRIDTDRS